MIFGDYKPLQANLFQKEESDIEKVKRMWDDWPDREKKTVHIEKGETTALEIPVYKIRVTYQDGSKELFRQESPTRPDPERLTSFYRYDLDATTYRFSEKDTELKFGDIKKKRLCTVNRDHVRTVAIVEETSRPVEVQYDVETVKVTESVGSYEKRHYSYHEKRPEKLLESFTPEELEKERDTTLLKARNVEVLSE